MIRFWYCLALIFLCINLSLAQSLPTDVPIPAPSLDRSNIPQSEKSKKAETINSATLEELLKALEQQGVLDISSINLSNPNNRFKEIDLDNNKLIKEYHVTLSGSAHCGVSGCTQYILQSNTSAEGNRYYFVYLKGVIARRLEVLETKTGALYDIELCTDKGCATWIYSGQTGQYSTQVSSPIKSANQNTWSMEPISLTHQQFKKYLTDNSFALIDGHTQFYRNGNRAWRILKGGKTPPNGRELTLLAYPKRGKLYAYYLHENRVQFAIRYKGLGTKLDVISDSGGNSDYPSFNNCINNVGCFTYYYDNDDYVYKLIEEDAARLDELVRKREEKEAAVLFEQRKQIVLKWMPYVLGGLGLITTIVLLNYRALQPTISNNEIRPGNVLLNVKALHRSHLGMGIVMFVGTVIGAAFAAIMIGIAVFPILGFAAPAVALAVLIIIPIYSLVITPLLASSSMLSPGNDIGLTILSNEHNLVKTVHQQCEKIGIPPVPFVGWYPSEDLNAFAMGTSGKNYTLGFSKALLDQLNIEEVNAVVGHELGHVLNNDMRRMQYGRSLQNCLTWFLGFYQVKKIARWFFTTVSELALMKLSRNREYWADAVGAALTSPTTMQNALLKISASSNTTSQNLPPKKYAAIMLNFPTSGFFATHPSMPERVTALENKLYYDRLPWLQDEGLSQD